MNDEWHDIKHYTGALVNCENMFHQKLQDQSNHFQLLLQEQEDRLSAETLSSSQFQAEITQLNGFLEEQQKNMDEMKEKINRLSNHLNYCKKKSQEFLVDKKKASLPLDEAIIKVVHDLLSFQQRYKLMKKSNVAHAIAKEIFNPSFVDGIVLPEVITLAKSWLRKMRLPLQKYRSRWIFEVGRSITKE